MNSIELSANPFALMMDPQAVLAAVARSERLGRLNSRICRPLDKGSAPVADAQTADFDAAVDDSVEPTLD
jgi:hypothetical protein